MNNVPLPYIRTNQIGIAAFVIFAFLVQLPLIIAIVWLIELIGLLFGTRANLFILFSKLFLSKWTDRAPTGEMKRFNTLVVVICLTLSVVFFEVGWVLAGYIVAGISAVVALIFKNRLTSIKRLS